MYICIATIRNKRGSILRYRILDTNTGKCEDIHSRSILNKIDNFNIRNLCNINNSVECTEGNLDNYPILIEGTNKAANINSPIIISLTDTDGTVCNFKGVIASAPIQTIIDKIKTFANGEIQSGKIILSKNNQASEKLTSKGASTNNQKKSNNAGYGLLRQVMNADDININIMNFDINSIKDSYNIDKRVFMPLSELANTVYDRSIIPEDKNAYSFDIVKEDNNVVLKAYHGEGYRGKVIIPDGVTHINKAVFAKAEAEEVEMPNTIVYIGDGAFESSAVKKVRLSDKVTAIPFACFMNSKLEEINLERITSIDNMAFTNCRISEVNLKGNIIQIGFEAFKGCTALYSFNHAGTIKKIRNHAFDGCINLPYFDFSSVLTIEQAAFNKTALTKVKLNGEVNYLQTGTFTGDIEEIELLDGFYKVAAGAVSNINNKPIIWTMPNSVTNIEKGAITKQDTVICYRKSVAASAGILAEANVVYLDDLEPGSIPKIFAKAKIIDKDIGELLAETLNKLLSQDESTGLTYDIDESKVIRLEIIPEIQELIPEYIKHTKFADDADIANERIKFKCILKHLYQSAPLDITPFSSIILKLKDTFRTDERKKIDTLYDDGVSAVYRIRYIDNKFTNVSSSFVIATTYNTLRYICMDNKYTDIMCEDKEVIDLQKLIDVLRPGDTIGLNSIISGAKYPEIVGESKKTIEVSKNGRKSEVNIKMNIYQALRYSSVTIKLDNNNIALLIPGNNIIIKCASLGKTVWLNEKEDTYSSLQATIESIEPLDNNTVFDYESSYKSPNMGSLIKRFMGMRESQYNSYIESYSHIYPAEQSMYRKAGDYAYQHGMVKISDLDISFLTLMFETELFEERNSAWLDKSVGKTVVPDAQFEFKLSDGSIIKQYRTVKKTALRNKLMVGGDRKLYIFDVYDRFGIQVGVYLSIYDIVTLVNMCLRDEGKANNQIFKTKDTFDIVDYDDMIEVATLCRDNELVLSPYKAQFILTVYKPNGLFYIGIKISNERLSKVIPVIQIGELDVALGFVEETNKFGLKSSSMRYLYEGGIKIIDWYLTDVLGIPSSTFMYRSSQNNGRYAVLNKVRNMCIDGISDIKEYNNTGIDEILKRCLGYSIQSFDYYKLGEQVIPHSIDSIDLDLDIDEEDLGDIELDISDGASNDSNLSADITEDNIDIGDGLRNLIMQQSDNIGNPTQNNDDIDLDFDIDEEDLGDI